MAKRETGILHAAAAAYRDQRRVMTTWETTLRLSDDLAAKLKDVAARESVTVNGLIVHMLRIALEEAEAANDDPPRQPRG